MEEEIKTAEQPNSAESNEVPSEAIIPEAPSNEPRGIALKFNKEIREVSLDEAVTLAQKGLKFDKISPELERIKSLANKKGMSIGEFISEIEKGELSRRRSELLESAGGNEELAEHILELEKNSEGKTDCFELLKKEFPEIKSPEDLPEEVLSEVDLMGGNMLSAYLLYLHRENRLSIESRLRQEENRANALGSQQKNAPEKTDANEEFIKGIWSLT